MFKSLYTKVFIGIVVFDMKSKIYVELLDRHNNITNVIVKDFNSLVVDDEMYVFISKFINKTPFYYISVLDNSTPQGMIATCLEEELSNRIDLDIFHHTCYKDKWAFYVAKQDIDILKNNYIKIGLDFIFSPFAVMVEFFKDKLDDEMVLFILMQDDSYAMSIFDEGKLLYSDHHVFNDDIMANQLRDEYASADGTLNYCRLNKIQVQAWTPVAYGRIFNPPAEADERLKNVARQLTVYAKEKGCGEDAVALAWLLRHPAKIQPVIGTTKPERIASSCKADGVEITREEWYTLFNLARGKAVP